MWWPIPANKTPRFFQPCPGNDEFQIEPGMIGIKDVAAGAEMWYRPFKTSVGDANPDPVLIATAADIAAIVAAYVTKATWDANTIVKADSDDTPIALPVGANTIIGRAATGGIAALTAAQVAAIINSNIAHNSTSGLNTGDYRHINPSPVAGVDGWAVAESDYFAGGTGEASVKPVGLNVLQIGQSFTDALGYSGTVKCGDYIFLNSSGTDTLKRFDLKTLQLLQTQAGYNQRALSCFGKNVIYVSGTLIKEIDHNDITQVVTKTVSIDVGTPISSRFRSSDGLIWIVNNAATPQLYTLSYGVTEYTASLVSTLTGITTEAFALTFDSTDSYFFVADFPSGAGSGYVRKYDTSGVLQTSSPAISTSGTTTPDLYVRDGFIYVAAGGKCTILNESTLSIISNESTGYNDAVYCFVDNLLYAFVVSSSVLVPTLYTLPALTLTSPRAVDMTQSDSIRVSAPGIAGVYTASDFIRNGVLRAGALWRDRLGVSVVSVETSLPASPVDGALYLINGGTSVYEGTVAEYIDAVGWAIHTPENGSSVIYGDYKYIYQNDRWEKTFEWYLKTELIDGSSSNPTGLLYMDSAGTPAVLPAISPGEALEIEILLTAKPISGSWASPTTITGKWKFDGLLGYESGQTIINDGLTTPVNFTDIITSASQYDLPNVGINAGDIEITVGVTFANSVTFEFSAVARGRVSSIKGYTVA